METDEGFDYFAPGTRSDNDVSAEPDLDFDNDAGIMTDIDVSSGLDLPRPETEFSPYLYAPGIPDLAAALRKALAILNSVVDSGPYDNAGDCVGCGTNKYDALNVHTPGCFWVEAQRFVQQPTGVEGAE